MAAGLGFKDFTTGEVLTAADVDGYLMQGIWVFASTAARDAAVTAPAEGNFAFTKDTNSLWYYDGAAWVASGATGDIEGVTAGIGISGGGTSGTVTVTNSMATAIDAKGDLIVGTGADTFSKLSVGANGTTLVADSSEATGLKWAAASSGSGLTLISRVAFSNVASQAFDNVFTSTYDAYLISIEEIYAATSTDDLHFQLRYGSTTRANAYYGATQKMPYTGAVSLTQMSNANQYTIATDSSQTTRRANGVIWINEVPGSQTCSWKGQFMDPQEINGYTFYGSNEASDQTHNGFLLKTSSSNISGTVAIYGLAKS